MEQERVVLWEALRVLQIAIQSGLNEAFKDWEGLEKVRNYNAYLSQTGLGDELKKIYEPIKIGLSIEISEKLYEYTVDINVASDSIYYVVEHEELICNGQVLFVTDIKDNENFAEVLYHDSTSNTMRTFMHYHEANSLIIGYRGSPRYLLGLEEFSSYIENWQFLYLNAHKMGETFKRQSESYN